MNRPIPVAHVPINNGKKYDLAQLCDDGRRKPLPDEKLGEISKKEKHMVV